MPEVIRPGDTVIIGWKQIDFYRTCHHGHGCHCTLDTEMTEARQVSFESSRKFWEMHLPGVKVVWMHQPHFEDHQIIAVYRPDSQPKPPPKDQDWVEVEDGLKRRAKDWVNRPKATFNPGGPVF